jgi:zinc transport system substrate-binding protein
MSTVSRKLIAALALGLILVIAAGYLLIAGNARPAAQAYGPSQDRKLQVTASFYPLYYFASVIGGSHVDVQNITPAGAEPHDFEPTSQDIARIEKGDLLILNGGLEAWGNKIRDELQGTKVTLVIAGEGLFSQQVVEQGQTAQDPHVWLSPPLAKKEVERILEGFRTVDPANRSDYEAQAKRLEDQLDQLDATYRAGLSQCRQTDIVTSHAAFGYLAQAYGLNQVAIAGLSPDAEPSARELADIANLAREKHINYIFFESLVSPKLAQTIADEVGAKTLVLDPLEGLTADQIRQGKTYFTVMQDNLMNLQTALECTR